jgi:ABC-2 type transport system ATP-binding protein
MIQFENVSKFYGNLLAVDNLDLTIESGEIFGFLGPNGAGKTTSMKMTSGLLIPSHGRVLVNGTDVKQHPEEAKQNLAFIPDTPYIYDKLNAFEFLALVGGLWKMDKKDVVEKTLYWFSVFGIGNWANERAEEYSHGMRQKVVLAASLMHDPKVLVVDEPMVGLDPQSQRIVKDVFRDCAKNGATVFLSTHTLSVAEEIADRVGIINKGKLLMTGNVSELRESLTQKETDLEELFIELTSNSVE